MSGGGAGRAVLAVVIAAAAGGAGCGKKGPPLPPLRPVPTAVAELTAERFERRVTLRLTIPAGNTDGTSPAAVDRVEIHALSIAPGAAAPTLAQVLDASTLIKTIEVRPAQAAPPKNKAAAAPGAAAASAEPPVDPRPAAGERVTYLDDLPGGGAAANAPTRYYAAAAFAGRRRGAASALIAVPLVKTPAPPDDLKIKNDETSFTLTWTSAGTTRMIVYAGSPGAAGASRLTPAPVGGAEFSTPVEFGRERCFFVRGVDVAGPVSVEGPASAPVCTTAQDVFPPPAPRDLVAVPGEGAIDLSWANVEAADLAGYLVFRAEGANEILQPLMREPVSETRYTDRNVRTGVTYSYQIVAIDKSGNPSARSERQQATAR